MKSISKELEFFLIQLEKENPRQYKKVYQGLSSDNILEVLRQMTDEGKVFVFYCGTSYAMGANAKDTDAIRRIYEAKGRDDSKPLSILSTKDNIEEWAYINDDIGSYVEEIVNTFWPGDVSIILPKKVENNAPVISDYVTSKMNTVHLTCIDPYTEKMSEYSKTPIAVTSANKSGMGIITSPIKAIQEFGDVVDGFLVGGDSNFKKSTTIVDFSVYPPTILRSGSQETVEKVKNILKK